MWTLYLGQLKTENCDSSSQNNDPQNFKNLITDLYNKLTTLKKEGEYNKESVRFWIDEEGDLHLADDETTILLTLKGTIQVDQPAA